MIYNIVLIENFKWAVCGVSHEWHLSLFSRCCVNCSCGYMALVVVFYHTYVFVLVVLFIFFALQSICITFTKGVVSPCVVL